MHLGEGASDVESSQERGEDLRRCSDRVGERTPGTAIVRVGTSMRRLWSVSVEAGRQRDMSFVGPDVPMHFVLDEFIDRAVRSMTAVAKYRRTATRIALVTLVAE
jgi:hypothetical protein